MRDIASGSLVVSTTTNSGSYSATLTAGKQYRWNVAAGNSSGLSAYTTPLYFQTPAAVVVPSTPSSPSPGSTSSPGATLSGSAVSLSWGAVSGATYYDIGVRDIASGNLVVSTTTSSPGYAATLAAGKQYRWNVAAGNTAGLSAYTTPLYFQTPAVVVIPATPSGPSPGSTSSPGSVLSGNTVTLTWSAVTGATYYDVGVRDIASGSLVVSTTTASVNYQTTLTAGKEYRWNVAAGNTAGLSAYTTPLYFQTPSAAAPAPVISGVTPSTMVGSTANQTLTINGSNFVSGATLSFTTPGGAVIASTASKLAFGSSSQITYQFNNDNDVGPWTVKVINPDGKTSGNGSFTVTAAPVAAPAISGVTPSTMEGSTSSQTLTINGSNFVIGATLSFTPPTGPVIASTASKLTYVSSGQISYQFNNDNDVGTWSVKVINPDGKTSGNGSFTVTAASAAAPVISGVTPSTMVGSTSNQTLTINGSNFVSGATLSFTPPTGPVIASAASKLTYVSSGQITYQFNNDNDVGTWGVKVINPDGKTSGNGSFTVTAAPAAAPRITGVNPASPVGADVAQAFTINGTGFLANCNVTLRTGGVPYANRVMSAFSSTAITINPNFTSVPATWTVEVINPDGQTTGEYSFQVTGSGGVAEYPGATWQRAATGNFEVANRAAADVRWIVLHTTEGTTASAVQRFSNPAEIASAHYIVSRDGSILQMVLNKDVAYTAGNLAYNRRAINIEHERYGANNWTEAQFAASANLVKWLLQRYSIALAFPPGIAPADPANGSGIIGHVQVPDPNDPTKPGGASGHTDPVNWDWARYQALVGVTPGAQTYAITTSSSPSAGGVTSGGGTKAAGASVTVTATPNTGYRFVNWTEGGAVVSAAANYAFTPTAARNLVAVFQAEASPGLFFDYGLTDLASGGQLEKLNYANRIGVRGDAKSHLIMAGVRVYELPVRLLKGEALDISQFGDSALAKFFVVAELADDPSVRSEFRPVSLAGKRASILDGKLLLYVNDADYAALGAPKRLAVYRQLTVSREKLLDGAGADRLAVLIHGWNRAEAGAPVRNPLGEAPFNTIAGELQTQLSGEGWSYVGYDWAADAATGGALFDKPDALLDVARSGTRAAEIGYQHGLALAQRLHNTRPGLTTIHFIAHSAGSWVAYAAARKLRESAPQLRVQITLLDPYMPAEAGDPSPLGKSLMQALRGQLASGGALLENYYCKDVPTGPGTEQVFGWDLDRRLEKWEFQPEFDFGKGHTGPVSYYAASMTDFDGELADGYGWNRSFFRRDLLARLELESLLNQSHSSTTARGGNISLIVDRYARVSVLMAESTPRTLFQGRSLMKSDGSFRVTDAATGATATGTAANTAKSLGEADGAAGSRRAAAAQTAVSLVIGGVPMQLPLIAMQPTLAAGAGLFGSKAADGTQAATLVLGDGRAHVAYVTPTAVVAAVGNVSSSGVIVATTDDGKVINASVGAGGVSIAASPSAGVTQTIMIPPVAAPRPIPARLANLSIRSITGVDARTLIVGVTIGGAGAEVRTKPIFVRGVGPSLAAFGVGDALADPTLRVFAGATQVDGNDNWGGAATVRDAAAALGAFPFVSAASKDAALSMASQPGSYTIQLSGVGGTAGVALAEIYDATPVSGVSATTARLTNVSARTQVGTGAEILIAGLVVAGGGAKTVLIRAVGPTLGQFGVVGALGDPQLAVFAGETRLEANDNWGGNALLQAAGNAVGAFALPVGSRDSALLVSLAPGAYTVQVSGVGGATGVALVEIYEVP